MPNKFIHEPWIAPDSIQRAAKCIIGKHYPLPMVNHAVASRINIERLKQVYQSLPKFRSSGYMYIQNTECEPSGGDITIQEPNSNFTIMDDSMVNNAADSMDMQCDISGKSLHDLLESAINDTFGTV